MLFNFLLTGLFNIGIKTIEAKITQQDKGNKMTCPDCEGKVIESYCPECEGLSCENCCGEDFYECEKCHEFFTLQDGDELEYV